MKTADLDFPLPEGLIALEPVKERDTSRLMVLGRADGSIAHRTFRDLPEYLKPGDMLLMNNSRVTPCRLIGAREDGRPMETLLVRPLGGERWEVLSRGGYSGKLTVDSGRIVLHMEAGRTAIVEAEGGLAAALEACGHMPLPPYIKRDPRREDRQWYQTVYAGPEGSIAAPTAGLHFTPALLERLSEGGVLIRYLTLHVGRGTFKPVRAEALREHEMDPESFVISKSLVEEIRGLRGRLVTVGTTATRAIESVLHDTYEKLPKPAQETIAGSTRLFITPGFEFKAVSGIVTNFHLPRSTPLALAASLAGTDRLLKAYAVATASSYRFFSYGDAMLIL